MYKVVRSPKLQVGVDGTIKMEGVIQGAKVEVANEYTLGGVMPKNKTNETKPVVVDEFGKLFTAEPETYKLPQASSDVLGGVKPTQGRHWRTRAQRRQGRHWRTRAQRRQGRHWRTRAERR